MIEESENLDVLEKKKYKMYYYDYDSFNTDVDYGYRFDVSMDRLYHSYEILYEVLKNPILRKVAGFVNECIAACHLVYRRCMLSATTSAESTVPLSSLIRPIYQS